MLLIRTTIQVYILSSNITFYFDVYCVMSDLQPLQAAMKFDKTDIQFYFEFVR